MKARKLWELVSTDVRPAAAVVGSLIEVDDHATVIARTPNLRQVDCPDVDRIRNSRRREHEVQLPGCRFRRLARVLKGRYTTAVPGQLLRPRVGLAAVRVFRPDETQAERLRSLEYGVLAYLPVRVGIFAVTTQQVYLLLTPPRADPQSGCPRLDPLGMIAVAAPENPLRER